jgi:predicted small secreted protein
MRNALRSFLAVAALALAGCYNTGDLTGQPFQCTGDALDCPDSYQCFFVDATMPKVAATSCGVVSGSPQNCICAIPCATDDECHAVSASSAGCNIVRGICNR